MDEGVGDQPPNLPMEPNLRAIEHRVIERASGTDRKKERGQDRTTDVETDKNCRDVDREPSHPGYRPIIIGGSDSEHAPIDSRRFLHASDLPCAEKILGEPPEPEEICPSL